MLDIVAFLFVLCFLFIYLFIYLFHILWHLLNTFFFALVSYHALQPLSYRLREISAPIFSTGSLPCFWNPEISNGTPYPNLASDRSETSYENDNLVPRVLRIFDQRLIARRDSGVLEFYYRRISAIKQRRPLQSLYRAANQIFFSNSPESLLAPTRWPKSLRTLCKRLGKWSLILKAEWSHGTLYTKCKMS